MSRKRVETHRLRTVPRGDPPAAADSRAAGRRLVLALGSDTHSHLALWSLTRAWMGFLPVILVNLTNVYKVLTCFIPSFIAF